MIDATRSANAAAPATPSSPTIASVTVDAAQQRVEITGTWSKIPVIGVAQFDATKERATITIMGWGTANGQQSCSLDISLLKPGSYHAALGFDMRNPTDIARFAFTKPGAAMNSTPKS